VVYVSGEFHFVSSVDELPDLPQYQSDGTAIMHRRIIAPSERLTIYSLPVYSHRSASPDTWLQIDHIQ
jgi:hypothetical protein